MELNMWFSNSSLEWTCYFKFLGKQLYFTSSPKFWLGSNAIFQIIPENTIGTGHTYIYFIQRISFLKIVKNPRFVQICQFCHVIHMTSTKIFICVPRQQLFWQNCNLEWERKASGNKTNFHHEMKRDSVMFSLLSISSNRQEIKYSWSTKMAQV